MNPYFDVLHYTASRVPGSGTPLDLLLIHNPDGSPRWIIPVHARKPYFLHFYHAGSVRAHLYALLMQLLFLFRLQHLLLEKQRWYVQPDNRMTTPPVDLHHDQWALFTGTVGPNNKMVLYTAAKGSGFFWKLATTPKAERLLDAEFHAARKLTALGVQTFDFPAMNLLSNTILKMSRVGEGGNRVGRFSKPHQNALTELYAHTLEVRPLHTISEFQAAMVGLSHYQTSPDPRIPAGLIQKLHYLRDYEQMKPVRCAFSHGDFTPWNLIVTDRRLSMFDLELAGERPLGFDAFHFVIQKGILTDRKSWTAILAEIEETVVPWLQPLLADTQNDWRYYLRLYLLTNTANHIGLYSRQDTWHTQVHWLMQTWNEALSDILAEERSQRGMLIGDLFTFLNPHPYATIKFPDIEPAMLDPYADIDLVVRKELASDVIQMLRSHPLIASVQVTPKSFMSSVQLVLKDTSLLNLDFIWDLMRKNVQMMASEEVLHRAQINRYGIKILQSDDLIHYLLLFYTLNGQPVPEKYHTHLSEIHPAHPLFSEVPGYQNGHQPDKTVIAQWLAQLPANRGLSALRNRIAYFFDTLRSYFGPSGMMITFSGVDGAGKSTVIELVRHEVEKRLRKRVVVLRHRPSLLPILSAWTKGKVRAEQQAAATLPRLGNNRSRLSSLVRFFYYYTDYLIGQFVVWARHIRRGDIVLYDRYYFDFINDSVRSNITLPPTLLRAGYQLLLKPELNFFLYADADTILSRKQELDRQTIGLLTERYLTLFSELNANRTPSRYIPVENRYLQETVSVIFTKIRHQAA